MSDDWENDDYVIPVLHIQTEEQIKRLEERRLVEESDNALTRNLFQEDINHEKYTYSNPKPLKSSKETLKKNIFSKQKENELKQKEISQKIKEDKLKRQREKELFGEAEENNAFAKYEKKFYY